MIWSASASPASTARGRRERAAFWEMDGSLQDNFLSLQEGAGNQGQGRLPNHQITRRLRRKPEFFSLYRTLELFRNFSGNSSFISQPMPTFSVFKGSGESHGNRSGRKNGILEENPGGGHGADFVVGNPSFNEVVASPHHRTGGKGAFGIFSDYKCHNKIRQPLRRGRDTEAFFRPR